MKHKSKIYFKNYYYYILIIYLVPDKVTAEQLYGIMTEDNSDTDTAIVISSESDSDSDSDTQITKTQPAKKVAKTKADSVARNFDDEEDFIAFTKSDNEDGSDKDTSKRKIRLQKVHNWGTPWFNHVKQARCRSYTDMLNTEMRDLIKFLSPTEEEHCLRQWVINKIAECLAKTIPGSSVQVYGSFNTKLYLPTSDLDLVVYVPEEDLDKDRSKYWLTKIGYYLKNENLAEDVEVVATAKVPIVKFIVPKVGYHIDISLNSDNGPVAAQVCIDLIKEYQGAQQLSLLVKHFLYQRNMNAVFSGGLGSYAVLLMVISFLQHHPLVRSKKINPLKNLGVLFFEFLDFYGNKFNGQNVAITTTNGGSYSKSVIDPKRKRNPDLTVWDPLDTKNNVTAGSFSYNMIKLAFARTYQALVLSLCLVSQSYEYLERTGRPQKPIPILKNLVQITEKDIEHRNKIKNLFYEMKLKKSDLLNKESKIGFY